MFVRLNGVRRLRRCFPPKSPAFFGLESILLCFLRALPCTGQRQLTKEQPGKMAVFDPSPWGLKWDGRDLIALRGYEGDTDVVRRTPKA